MPLSPTPPQASICLSHGKRPAHLTWPKQSNLVWNKSFGFVHASAEKSTFLVDTKINKRYFEGMEQGKRLVGKLEGKRREMHVQEEETVQEAGRERC